MTDTVRERLIIKHFGPLKDIDIKLSKINLFIGENGSGKSVLGKIITIILNYYDNYSDEKKIIEKFKDFNIDYIKKNTIIKYYVDDELVFNLEKEKITLSEEGKIDVDLLNLIKLEEDLNNLETRFIDEKELDKLEKLKHIKDNLAELKSNNQVFKKVDTLKAFRTQYIPAERNLISLFNQSLSSLVSSEIPLPKFLLDFSSNYLKARQDIKELNFLNVKYEYKNEKEHIFYNDKNALFLEYSSSGIQSALPLFLTLKYFAKRFSSIVIEEPELSLFPEAQSETLKYIIAEGLENNLFIMTHSPYNLSILNNLLFAYKISLLDEKLISKINKIINVKYWINPEHFVAYYIHDGKARSIMSKRGLISDNEIDDISEDISGQFDELLEIYRDHKNDK